MSIRVPRVHIYIPGNTSRSRFEPAYVLPILQREHHGRLADPADGIRITEHPPECQAEHFRWKTITSIEEERAGLAKIFGDAFFACYPTEHDFRRAFGQAVDDAARMEDLHERSLPQPVETADIPAELAALKVRGFTAAKYALIAARGLDEIAEIAKADPVALAMLLDNASLAKRLIAACKEALAARPAGDQIIEDVGSDQE